MIQIMYGIFKFIATEKMHPYFAYTHMKNAIYDAVKALKQLKSKNNH